MTPEDRAKYGFGRVRNAAFDAVQGLWRRRKANGLTILELSQRLNKDPGWVSRNLKGPGNWTMRTFGGFVEGLDGEAEIIVHAIEDPVLPAPNYDAYTEIEAAANLLGGLRKGPTTKGTQDTVVLPTEATRASVELPK